MSRSGWEMDRALKCVEQGRTSWEGWRATSWTPFTSDPERASGEIHSDQLKYSVWQLSGGALGVNDWGVQFSACPLPSLFNPLGRPCLFFPACSNTQGRPCVRWLVLFLNTTPPVRHKDQRHQGEGNSCRQQTKLAKGMNHKCLKIDQPETHQTHQPN